MVFRSRDLLSVEVQLRSLFRGFSPFCDEIGNIVLRMGLLRRGRLRIHALSYARELWEPLFGAWFSRVLVCDEGVHSKLQAYIRFGLKDASAIVPVVSVGFFQFDCGISHNELFEMCCYNRSKGK